jgi:hypothetical protein
MGKLIIDNQTSLKDIDALALVSRVMMGERISNSGKQYCYVSVFNAEGEEIVVSSHLNKSSDRFVVQSAAKGPRLAK